MTAAIRTLLTDINAGSSSIFVLSERAFKQQKRGRKAPLFVLLRVTVGAERHVIFLKIGVLWIVLGNRSARALIRVGMLLTFFKKLELLFSLRLKF